MAAKKVPIDVYIRLRGGPLQLPKAVLKERPTIALFLTYLRQKVTENALANLVDRKAERGLRENIWRLKNTAADTNEGLCLSTHKAVILRDIVKLARGLNEDILPQKALPSNACLDAFVKAYHEWVQELAATTFK